MKLCCVFVDVAVAAEPWASAAVASSSVTQDERHTDRNQIVRQVVALLIDSTLHHCVSSYCFFMDSVLLYCFL